MSVYPKFIIEGDNLVIGNCARHNQLCLDPKSVKGGGMWHYSGGDTVTDEIVLMGSSHEFGRCQIEDVRLAVESGNVFTDKIQTKRLEGKTFVFVDWYGDRTTLTTQTQAV